MLEIQFAPLQGYTDAAYRRFHNEIYGSCIGRYFSPFVRIEKWAVRNKDIKDISPENNEGITLVPQIIVNSISEFKILVDAITTLGYNQIDINMGCPFPLQTGKGRGAGLLSCIDVVKGIMEEIKKCQEVSFSIKMRLGLDDCNESVELLPIINDAPLKQVVIHPRIGRQQYKGNVDIDAFERLYNEIAHPIIYNGDILEVKDIYNIASRYPRLAGVMIGRGLLADPSMAMEYKQDISLDKEQKKSLFFKLHEKLFHYYSNILQGDSQLLMKMKTIWDYQEGAIGHKALKSIKKSTTIAKYQAAVSAIQ